MTEPPSWLVFVRLGAGHPAPANINGDRRMLAVSLVATLLVQHRPQILAMLPPTLRRLFPPF